MDIELHMVACRKKLEITFPFDCLCLRLASYTLIAPSSKFVPERISGVRPDFNLDSP